MGTYVQWCERSCCTAAVRAEGLLPCGLQAHAHGSEAHGHDHGHGHGHEDEHEHGGPPEGMAGLVLVGGGVLCLTSSSS